MARAARGRLLVRVCRRCFGGDQPAGACTEGHEPAQRGANDGSATKARGHGARGTGLLARPRPRAIGRAAGPGCGVARQVGGGFAQGRSRPLPAAREKGRKARQARQVASSDAAKRNGRGATSATQG